MRRTLFVLAFLLAPTIGFAQSSDPGQSAVQRLGLATAQFAAQWAVAAAKVDELSAQLSALHAQHRQDAAELEYWRQWVEGVLTTAPR